MSDEYQGSAESWRICYEAEKAEKEILIAENKVLRAFCFSLGSEAGVSYDEVKELIDPVATQQDYRAARGVLADPTATQHTQIGGEDTLNDRGSDDYANPDDYYSSQATILKKDLADTRQCPRCMREFQSGAPGDIYCGAECAEAAY